MNEQFKNLWRLAQREGAKLNMIPSDVFSDLGLYLVEPVFESWGYSETPTNAMTFAFTGVDGDHFSFLCHDGQLTSPCPIVMTVPMASKENWNLIVGEDLLDFLRLGYQAHFAAIPALAYSQTEREEFITRLTNRTPMWQGEAQDDHSVIAQKYLSGVLEVEFGLHPWDGIEAKLDNLAGKYLHLIEGGGR